MLGANHDTALTAFRSGRPTAYFWNTFFNDGLRDTGGAYIVGRKVHKRSTREMLLVIIDTMYVAAVEIWMGQLRVLSGAVHRYLGGHVSHWGRPVYRVHREGTGTRVQLSQHSTLTKP